VPAERADPAGAARAGIGAKCNPWSSVMTSSHRWRVFDHAIAAILAVALHGAPAAAQRLLVPMDDAQQNHLKAYGLTYNALKAGLKAEWLLNYRGGSFLLPDTPELRRQSGLDGITAQSIDEGQLSAIRAEIAAANMDAIPLEKAPRIAV